MTEVNMAVEAGRLLKMRPKCFRKLGERPGTIAVKYHSG
jgi:hypothetical protein